MSEEYVVPAELLARCVGRTDLVQRVLAAFIRQVNVDVPKLAADLLAGDFAGAAKTAHRIKGASANVAADRLCASAKQIEDLTRSGQVESVSVQAQVDQLQADWNQIVELTAEFLE